MANINFPNAYVNYFINPVGLFKRMVHSKYDKGTNPGHQEFLDGKLCRPDYVR